VILVVDASVATMWFVPRNHSANAMLLLAQEFELVAPALIRIEIASALLKASRRKEIAAADIEEALDLILPNAIRFLSIDDYVRPAFEIARRLGGSLYDGIYIAAARDLGAPLITDDATMGETARRARIKTLMIADGPPVARD
jgi:hypothetical protein